MVCPGCGAPDDQGCRRGCPEVNAKNSPLFSSEKDNWQTPKALFDELNAEFHFTIDAAADKTNHLLPRWYGPDSPVGWTDALSVSWAGETCWLNPPYSMVKEFIQKAAMEQLNGVTTVALIPSRTDTRWWHDFIWNRQRHRPYYNVSLRFIKGRLKFVNVDRPHQKNSAPFPSVIVIFKGV